VCEARRAREARVQLPEGEARTMKNVKARPPVFAHGPYPQLGG